MINPEVVCLGIDTESFGFLTSIADTYDVELTADWRSRELNISWNLSGNGRRGANLRDNDLSSGWSGNKLDNFDSESNCGKSLICFRGIVTIGI